MNDDKQAQLDQLRTGAARIKTRSACCRTQGHRLDRRA